MARPMKKRSVFVPVTIIIFTLIFIAILFVWEYFYRWLAAYEDSQPSYYAEQVVQLYRDGKIEEILAMQGETVNRYNTIDEFSEYIERVYGDLSQASAYKSGVDGENVIYTVYTGNTKLCDITLYPDGNVNEYGFSGWNVTMEKFDFPKKYTAEVCVPKGATVYLNGRALEEWNRIDGGYAVTAYNDLDDKTLCPQFETYRVANLLNEPEISVKYNDADMTLTKENGKLFALPEITEEMEKQAKEFSSEVAVEYALYGIIERSLKDIEPYLVVESEYYRRLKYFQNDWYVNNGFSHSDIVHENLRYYDDEHYSVRVSFTYYVNIGYRTNEYDVCYDMYFVKINNEWKLATMQL